MPSSGGSRPSDKGGGGGGADPWAPPLDPPLHCYSDIAEILNPSNVDIPTKRTLFVPSKANHIEEFRHFCINIKTFCQTWLL